MGRKLAAAALCLFLVSAGSGTVTAKIREPNPRLKAKNVLLETLRGGKTKTISHCSLEGKELVYKYNDEKLDFLVRMKIKLYKDEQILGYSCFSDISIILTNKKLLVYPGITQLVEMPEEAVVGEIDLDEIDAGVVSSKEHLVVFKQGRRVEAYKITTMGMENILSVDMENPITSMRLDEGRRRIIIDCGKNGETHFGYDGKLLE